MNESHGDWTATLTLYSDSDSPQHRPESEHYVLSKKNTTFIGRSTECQIVLRSKYATVSRYHAKIEFTNLEDQFIWQICDLETPNGTFVNDQRIEGCQSLRSGDHVTLGKPKGAQFVFEYNLLDTEDLVDLFNKEQPYKKTYVPDLSDEVRTEFKPISNRSIEIHDSDLIQSSIPIIEEVLITENPPTKKSFSVNLLKKVSIKNLLVLALISLILPPLVYNITAAFEAQKNSNTVLKSYIDNVSELLLDKSLDNLDPFDQEARKARESANGQIRIALRSLEGSSKGSLIRFLYDSKLIRLQPIKLRSAWFSHKNKFSNIGLIELSKQDLRRQELIYSRQFNFSSLQSSSPFILLMDRSALNTTQKNKKNRCNTPSVPNQIKPDCAWGITFDLQANEQPFITPTQLSGADLTGVILKDAPLDGINLEGAYLSLSDCAQHSSESFLEQSYHQWTRWFSQNQCSADLSNAGLQNARLFRAVLRGANLRNAKLDYADLRQADLRAANLTGVQWPGAILKDACYLKENWQKNFPAKGPDGLPFNPISAGMKPMTEQNSNPHQPNSFQECKTNTTQLD